MLDVFNHIILFSSHKWGLVSSPFPLKTELRISGKMILSPIARTIYNCNLNQCILQDIYDLLDYSFSKLVKVDIKYVAGDNWFHFQQSYTELQSFPLIRSL